MTEGGSGGGGRTRETLQLITDAIDQRSTGDWRGCARGTTVRTYLLSIKTLELKMKICHLHHDNIWTRVSVTCELWDCVREQNVPFLISAHKTKQHETFQDLNINDGTSDTRYDNLLPEVIITVLRSLLRKNSL